jgi:succinate dehydrogenase / fumarate reductase cytochrome b subunit
MKRPLTPSGARPLSPHLSIYSTQVTSAFSVLHRGTGIFLTLVLFAAIFSLDFISYGFPNYSIWRVSSAFTTGLAAEVISALMVAAISFALFLHLLTGIRHLIWDWMLFGFDLKQAKLSAQIISFLAFFLTFLTLFHYLEF